jgi:beta-galactosidase
MRKTLVIVLITAFYMPFLQAQNESISAKEYSTAGFYAAKGSGRNVYNFNVAWKFYKGDIDSAWKKDFNDSQWDIVHLPHGLELLPAEASGGVNYQGPAWYRKHFMVPDELKGRKIFLYIEAIMGKSKIYINGRLIKEHYGGYLPVVVDLSEAGVKAGDNCLIAVRADNSDDPSYPPGKPEGSLDFTYAGGIYRDVWLYSTSACHITDPDFTDKTAGGGVFIHTENLTENKADVVIQTDVINEEKVRKTMILETSLRDATGNIIGKQRSRIVLSPGESNQFKQIIKVNHPHLWTPDDPYLYKTFSILKTTRNEPLDGFYTRTGIRKIEFRGKQGFYLNNKPFGDKLIGANRHQDFAYLGNALPNSGQWRDAKKLRDAGMRIIRSAHYPQDPAFMDACDELGLFVIVATPGWQFWNKDSTFEQRVYNNIRNMVRRDRNHPSVIMWEPILNETHYPDNFARDAYDAVHSEYPYQGCYAVCDSRSRGAAEYDVIYSHPMDLARYARTDKCIFTREWGDNVDDWSSHNSPSRVARSWGEVPQLIQAMHYADPPYPYTCYESLYKTPPQHVGGCLWHPFDHQRGYHPDPFWGGIMDNFRQPKYSYYMFKSQRPGNQTLSMAENGYMIYIANEMTPFSPQDVTVFTNCDSVRLIVLSKDTLMMKVDHGDPGMPSHPVLFSNVYNFMQIKELHRRKKPQRASLIAEGIVNGKVVATYKRMPALRPAKITLKIDNEGLPLVANGSDVVPVIASITDDEGHVKRLNKEYIHFTVEGAGSIIGDETIDANPRPVEWGTAPVLIRSSPRPGKIRINASIALPGINTPKEASIEIESVLSPVKMLYQDIEVSSDRKVFMQNDDQKTIQQLKNKLEKVTNKLNELRLKQVEKDQELFEGNKQREN